MIRPTIGITIGDPSGIGPEVVLKALAKPNVRKLAKFLIIGDSFVLRRLNTQMSTDLSVAICDKKQMSTDRDLRSSVPNIQLLDLHNVPEHNFNFGKISPVYGKASIEYINEAIKLIRKNKIDALVTAPVSKEAINLTGISFSGHTEYLADSFKVKKFAMMLIGGKLKVVLITRHLPLKKVSNNLNPQSIVETITLTYCALKKYFNINRPRIGVCGLNPHSGEKGLLGEEEIKIIKPAILKLKKRKTSIDLEGPLPADVIFYKARKGEYDCVIAMYHDQGLIPLKMTAFDRGVNLTLGLPFIRTSPLHGTGFNIAGKRLARPQSMIEAIRLACNLAR